MATHVGYMCFTVVILFILPRKTVVT